MWLVGNGNGLVRGRVSLWGQTLRSVGLSEGPKLHTGEKEPELQAGHASTYQLELQNSGRAEHTVLCWPSTGKTPSWFPQHLAQCDYKLGG